MAVFDREAFLRAPDIHPVLVHVAVPGWGDVYVRALTAAERDEYDQMLAVVKADGEAEPEFKNARAKLIVMGVCDEKGNRIFSMADVPLLGTKNGAAIGFLYQKILHLSGMSVAASRELEKNSVSDQKLTSA